MAQDLRQRRNIRILLHPVGGECMPEGVDTAPGKFGLVQDGSESITLRAAVMRLPGLADASSMMEVSTSTASVRAI